MNPNALILGPTGQPLIAVGQHAFRTFSRGQYNVSIEWHIEGRSAEPVMAIWRKRGGQNAPVYAFSRSLMAVYLDPTGDPTPELARVVLREVLPHLNLERSEMEARRIIEVVVRHYPDLHECPPAPPEVRRAEVGEPLIEITQITNGKRVDEAVL